MLGDFLDIKSTIHDGYHMITWPITLRSLPFHAPKKITTSICTFHTGCTELYQGSSVQNDGLKMFEPLFTACNLG